MNNLRDALEQKFKATPLKACPRDPSINDRASEWTDARIEWTRFRIYFNSIEIYPRAAGRAGQRHLPNCQIAPLPPKSTLDTGIANKTV